MLDLGASDEQFHESLPADESSSPSSFPASVPRRCLGLPQVPAPMSADDLGRWGGPVVFEAPVLEGEGIFQRPLIGRIAQIQKIEDVRVFRNLLGEVGLGWGQRYLQIRDGLALAEMERGVDLEREHVARTTVFHGPGGIPEAVRRLFQFLQEHTVMHPRNLCSRLLQNSRRRPGGLCKGRLHNFGMPSVAFA